MIGAIKPPREGGTPSWLGLVGLYTVGAMIGSGATGSAAGAVGSATGIHDHLRGTVIALGLLSLMLVPFDLGLSGLRVPGFRRQTQKAWRDMYGQHRAAFLWGLHLGVGALTIRVTSLYWLGLLVVLGLGSVSVGALTFAAYGIALGLSLALGGLLLDGGDFGRPLAALRLSMNLRPATALLLAVSGALLLVAGFVLSP